VHLRERDGSSITKFSELRGVRIVHTLFFLLICLSTWSQSTSVWVTGQLPIRRGDWEWHNDASYRTADFRLKANQWFYRTGLRHYFKEGWSTAIGYARFNTRNVDEEKVFQKEDRIWEEVMRVGKAQKGQWMQRLRLEQRWFQSTPTHPSSFFWRSRLRLARVWPLSNRWDVQVYDEYMHHFNGVIQKMNQNRLGFFLHYKRTASFTVNLGYTWMQMPQGSTHVFMIGFQQSDVD
jgi:Protein of unknown function (DUF2490)